MSSRATINQFFAQISCDSVDKRRWSGENLIDKMCHFALNKIFAGLLSRIQIEFYFVFFLLIIFHFTPQTILFSNGNLLTHRMLLETLAVDVG